MTSILLLEQAGNAIVDGNKYRRVGSSHNVRETFFSRGRAELQDIILI